jgi:hypothetical protein
MTANQRLSGASAADIAVLPGRCREVSHHGRRANLRRAGQRTVVLVSDDRTSSDDSGDSELAAYGQAVDVAVHVPTLSGAIAAGAVAAVVWIWRQLRHGRAAAISRRG